MSTIYDLIPDHEVLLDLEPEELAGIVLEYLNSLVPADRGQLNRYNFSLPHTVTEYPNEVQNEVIHALMEAWMWLEREGLLAPKPGTQGEWVFITRRGQSLEKSTDLETYRNADRLPKKLLHPVIAQKVYHLFLRGDYDIAVFQAFKEVEVAVRDAGSYTAEDRGSYQLMRKAFHPETGNLKDANQTADEKQATSDLFAGAMGLYRNPHAHRNIPVTPEEAVEIIMFASHLLRIVDSRSQMSIAP